MVVKIQILISTLNSGLFNISYDNKFSYLIVHQVNDGKKNSYQSHIENLKSDASLDLKYLQSDSLGLTFSRNLCLQNAAEDADYYWIMDDDVMLHPDAYNRLSKGLLGKYSDKYLVDVFIVNHSSNINDKVIGQCHFHNFITAASIASIDIIFSRDVLHCGVIFNSNFGLGSRYPSGEEYIFITDLMKLKYSVYQSDMVVSYHPPLASGLDFYTSPLKLVAKKKMFIRIFGDYLGFFLYFLFILKKSPILIVTRKIDVLFNVFKSFFKN